MGTEWGIVEGYTVAYYRPRAFFIKLNFVTDSPTLHGLMETPGTMPTLLHEVGHLVQDRATIFGVRDFLGFYKGMSSFQRYINRVPAGEPIPIPARAQLVNGCIPGETAPMWMAQAEAVRETIYPRLTWPDDGQHWAYIDHSIAERDFRLGEESFRIPAVTVRMVDNVHEGELVHLLGAWEIKEAYSVAVSLIHGGKEPDPREGYEYFVVDRILQKEFGEVGPKQTIAICHWALQDLSPGRHFFRLVEALLKAYHAPLAPADEIYDFCRKVTMDNGYAETTQKLCDELEARAQQHRKVNPNGSFVALLEWYAGGARTFLDLNRVPGRRFPIDTFFMVESKDLSAERFQDGLESLLREMPVPMIETANGFIYAMGGKSTDDGSVFFIRSLAHLTNAVWAGRDSEWRCPLYEACELAIKDDMCRVRPWDKGALEATCGMGAAAKYLALTGRSFRFVAGK
jgi:hypothetical protein